MEIGLLYIAGLKFEKTFPLFTNFKLPGTKLLIQLLKLLSCCVTKYVVLVLHENLGQGSWPFLLKIMCTNEGMTVLEEID